jgi:hypothetical protein
MMERFQTLFFRFQFAPLQLGIIARHPPVCFALMATIYAGYGYMMVWVPKQQGGAVQVDPVKPTLKARISERLKLRCDDLLSNFAFKFNLRRYTKRTKRTTSTPSCA